MSGRPPLVIHVPHASLWIPDALRDQFTISADALASEARLSADLHTDLLARAAWPQARIVSAEVSRVVVDVERYEDDAQEVMAGVGRGVVYRCDRLGWPMRRPLDRAEREALLDRFYRPHWRHLREAARDAVLIDLHSYPRDRWPIEPPSDGSRPEIDLGFEPGLSPDAWVAELTAHFEARGYRVGHNTPYAGVIDAGARAAVMVEIRRDVVGTPGDGQWTRLVSALAAMPMPAL